MGRGAALDKWVFPALFVGAADEEKVRECEDKTAELVPIGCPDVSEEKVLSVKPDSPKPEIGELRTYIKKSSRFG